MGEAADDMLDHLMDKQFEYDMMMIDVRKHCNHPEGACKLVNATYEDEDDWLPFQCVVCREKFDY